MIKLPARRLGAALLVFGLMAGAAACGNDDDETSVSDKAEQAADDAKEAVDNAVDDAKEAADDALDAANDAATDAKDAVDDAVDDATEAIGDLGPDSGKDLNVGLAYDLGGRGDKSFNDAAAAGLDEAKAKYGVSAKELSPAKEEDRKENLKLLAETGNNPVIGVGFSFADPMTEVAASFPDTTFAVIDSVVEADNVASNVFAEEQGSFLVCAAAALKSQTGKIGFIGGVEIDLIKKFEAGCTAGAKQVKPDITVEVKYITPAGDFSGFSAPDKAKEIAGAMYQGGADVIFHAAGGSGGGLFEAAVAAGDGKWAIGVDSDQYQSATPEQQAHILTSMTKRVDVAVRTIIEEAISGDLKGGETKTFDLSNDGVGYATSGGYVDDISSQLDELKAKIVSGEITVPTTP
jgi:basic membrane protein A